MSDFPQMLPIRQAAAVSGLAVNAVRVLVKQNRVAHVQCGKRCMVNMNSLAALCNGTPDVAAPTPDPQPGGIRRIEV